MPGDPIVLATTKSSSIYEITNLEVITNIFIRSFCGPKNMANDPQVENH